MTPHITNDHINVDNLANLISILETVFRDLDKVAHMERKLRKLWQANWEFSTYYAKFIRYAANTTWNKVAKRLYISNTFYLRPVRQTHGALWWKLTDYDSEVAVSRVGACLHFSPTFGTYCAYRVSLGRRRVDTYCFQL